MIRQLAGTTAFILLLLGAAPVSAQRPPDQTFPDERVNVNIAPSSDQPFEGSLLIIRTDDTDANVDYNARIYELAVEGWELLPFLNDIVEKEGGSVDFWTYTDPESGEVRHYIQAVTADYQFEDIDNLVRHFNRPGATSHRGGMRRHVRVRHRLASDLAGILRSGVISSDGFVEADDATNSLFIRDSFSDGERALQVMRFYDVPQRMVEMDIRIIEVDVTDNSRLGLDWEAWKNSIGGFLQFSAAERSGLPGDFTSFDLLLNLDARVLADFLNYLVRTGSASIVTHSTLTAVNGESATLESGRRVPRIRHVPAPGIVKVVDTLPEGSGGLIAEEGGLRSIRVDVDDALEMLSLRIFPRIGAETMVAEISATIASVVTEDILNEPVLAESRIESIIRLHDGEPVLVGAFDKRRESQVRSGLPLLRSIPLIGPALFQTNSVRSEHSKLVLLMTPHLDEHLRYTDEQLEYGRRIEDPELPPFARRNPPRIDPERLHPAQLHGPHALSDLEFGLESPVSRPSADGS